MEFFLMKNRVHFSVSALGIFVFFVGLICPGVYGQWGGGTARTTRDSFGKTTTTTQGNFPW